MYICLIKVSAYKHINHAFVKHFVLFLQCVSICPYVVIAVFVLSRLPHTNFALDNTTLSFGNQLYFHH